mgnify:CR=1 FL=1
MKVLISTCLLGVACKYSGGDNARPTLVAALQAAGHELVPVCPEVYGGLPTPRTPAERISSRRGGRPCRGRPLTAQYRKGAEIALQLASLTGCRVAVLKANSPSCGHGTIYDGTFSGKKNSRQRCSRRAAGTKRNCRLYGRGLCRGTALLTITNHDDTR